MPPEITVSAKIRLLPSQEDTLELMERIVNTGISCLMVHCRTRNMRMREKATIERLREIVKFVERMGNGTAVIKNSNCLGYEDSKRVRQVTGVSSSLFRVVFVPCSCYSASRRRTLGCDSGRGEPDVFLSVAAQKTSSWRLCLRTSSL